LIDSRKPLSSTNIRIRDLFTGSAEEQHFFLTSARIEIRGLEALEVIGESLRKIERWGDGAERKPTVVIGYLTKLSLILEDIASILVNVKSGCDPHFFFFTFRPVRHYRFVRVG
jgi:indoleamine 2,3-dioxygenase